MPEYIELPNTTLEDLLLRMDENASGIFALKSYSRDGWGTVLAWDPSATFRPNVNISKTAEAVAAIEQFCQEQHQLDRLVIGYMSYDFGCLLHNIPLAKSNGLNIPIVLAASFDSYISFNKSSAEIHSSDPKFINEVKSILSRPARKLNLKAYHESLKPTIPRSRYSEAYRKVEDYIKAGDVYQINLTHQLEGTTAMSGQDLFCLLSRKSQSDFQAFVALEDFAILSLSPERFIRVKDRAIETSPIKGTRPRGKNAAQDKALRQDLLKSPKDAAELNMITDLMRNDLGAICKVGSVKVKDKRVITGYPTLWHAHSTIRGVLRDRISEVAALASLMPGGSITGCPKKRAMEIIYELEPQQRSIYSGSIFTIKPETGELDSSIAIRTMIKKAKHLYLSVGGGIVSDSLEDEEYQESMDKAASFMDIK